jgi:DNA primase
MSTWVNFKELRAKLDFEQVLRHYGVEVRRKGDQHQGFCPLPNHKGKKNSPSFSANLKRGIFKCFGCGAMGNVLEFAALMENVDLENGAAFRGVAVELQKRFCPELGSVTKADRKPAAKVEVDAAKEEDLPVVVNPPLDFGLKELDYNHPYLRARGFTRETIDEFGLGFCSRGFLKDRVAIPLHDHEGKLVGYAGRVVDDATISKENPRYRFPSKRKRAGKIIEFRKTLFLYNGFGVRAPADDLVVTEGFASVWWLHQNGYPQAVATMGADCSERQAELIVSLVKPSGRVWIIPDGDDAGRRFAQSLLLHVSPHRFMRWVKIEEGIQATDLSKEQLRACFTS